MIKKTFYLYSSLNKAIKYLKNYINRTVLCWFIIAFLFLIFSYNKFYILFREKLIIFVIDNSKSMEEPYKYNKKYTKLQALKIELQKYFKRKDKLKNFYSVFIYSEYHNEYSLKNIINLKPEASLLAGRILLNQTNNKKSLIHSINSIKIDNNSGSPLSEVLYKVMSYIASVEKKYNEVIVLFLTDGDDINDESGLIFKSNKNILNLNLWDKFLYKLRLNTIAIQSLNDIPEYKRRLKILAKEGHGNFYILKNFKNIGKLIGKANNDDISYFYFALAFFIITVIGIIFIQRKEK